MVTRPRIVRTPEASEPPPETAAPPDPVARIDADFDEQLYRRAFPDIAEAVRRGSLASGLAHFQMAGKAEGRLEKPEYRALLAAHEGIAAPQVSIDALTISHTGATLMTGWSDDRMDPLAGISLPTTPDSRHDWTAIPRLIRPDVGRTLDMASHHPYGFLLVAAPVGGSAAAPIDPKAADTPVFRFASGAETRLQRVPAIASDADLRDLALAALPAAAPGETDPAVLRGILDQHVGVQIAAINRLIVDRARTRRLVERIGPSRARYRGTVIVNARGPADQIVPWLTLAADGAEAADYEFIVVVTSPDQFEPAIRAARLVLATIGLGLTLVLQRDGDPAGPGDDGAADVARSDRLIFMDQTVFPRDPGWTRAHSAILAGLPAARTRLFGGLLYHADGSLANGGYYFDTGLSVIAGEDNAPRRIPTFALKTVVHPVPALAPDLTVSRPVLGVPAAFLSVDRGWFEHLGGFTRLYARAAHEDIDLCLRGLKQNVPAWVHPLPMWHLPRRPPARPEPSRGGAILNDWLLHRLWDGMLVPEWLGPNPTLPQSE